MVGLLIFEFGISLPEFIVRDVAVDIVFMQIFHIGFVGVTRIRSNERIIQFDAKSFETIKDTLYDRLQGMMLLAFIEGLGVDNDLMFLSTVAMSL